MSREKITIKCIKGVKKGTVGLYNKKKALVLLKSGCWKKEEKLNEENNNGRVIKLKRI